jgi:hypothetical protein
VNGDPTASPPAPQPLDRVRAASEALRAAQAAGIDVAVNGGSTISLTIPPLEPSAEAEILDALKRHKLEIIELLGSS